MPKIFSKNKKGLTLIETVMSIVILVVGIAGFSLLFSRTWRLNSYTLEMGQSSMAVSVGLNKMVRYIREAEQGDNGAYAIVLAKDNELTIYSDYNSNGKMERLHFYKSGENILMGITEPTSSIPKTYPAGDSQTVTIASKIVNNDSTPIFYYYNKNYPGDTTNNPVATPAAVSDVRLVKIYLKININPHRVPDSVEMQSFAELRNLND